MQYFIQWKEYKFKYNIWLSIQKLNDAINLIKKYNKTFLSYTDMTEDCINKVIIKLS